MGIYYLVHTQRVRPSNHTHTHAPSRLAIGFFVWAGWWSGPFERLELLSIVSDRQLFKTKNWQGEGFQRYKKVGGDYSGRTYAA